MTADLPPEIDPLPPLQSLPDEVERVGTDLRTVAVELQDVQAWADRGAAPPGWSGDAAEAAHHAATRLARRVDVAADALRRASTATAAFEDRQSTLRSRGLALDSTRVGLNDDIAGLRAKLGGATPPPPGLEAMTACLHERAAALRDEIAAWCHDVADSEAAYVEALRAIDTVTGAGRAAGEPGTPGVPDAAGLRQRLGQALATGGAAAVALWWRQLTGAERETLIVAYPGLVGSTDGVPATERDRANRAHAEALLGCLRQVGPADLTAAQRQELHNLGELQQLIHRYRHAVDPVTGRNLLHLLQYDPAAYAGDGSSVVSLGDPDAARVVSTYTPGFSAHGGELDGMDQVGALHHDLVRRYGQHLPTATILWDHYDNPSLDRGLDDLTDPDTGAFDQDARDAAAVLTTGVAARAGHRLARFLNALGATHHAGPPEVTVIGHSYGSVVAAYAAHSHAAADNVVLLADPGAPGHDVHDLVDGHGPHVYVGDDDHDPVSLLGRGPAGGVGALGHDPAAASYGATRIPVARGPERLGDLLGNHSAAKYLRGAALHNVTTIEGGGLPDQVPGRRSGSYENLAHLLGHATTKQFPVVGAVGSELAHSPDGQLMRMLWAHLPGSARHRLAELGLDSADGLAGGLDSDLDGIAEATHRAPHLPGPLGWPGDAMSDGVGAVTHQVDGMTHKLSTVVGLLKAALS